MGVQRRQTLWMKRQRRHADLTISKELDALTSAVRCHDLILAAHRLLQPNLLHMDRFVRQPFLARNVAFQRMKRMKQPDHK